MSPAIALLDYRHMQSLFLRFVTYLKDILARYLPLLSHLLLVFTLVMRYYMNGSYLRKVRVCHGNGAQHRRSAGDRV